MCVAYIRLRSFGILSVLLAAPGHYRSLVRDDTRNPNGAQRRFPTVHKHENVNSLLAPAEFVGVRFRKKRILYFAALGISGAPMDPQKSHSAARGEINDALVEAKRSLLLKAKVHSDKSTTGTIQAACVAPVLASGCT